MSDSNGPTTIALISGNGQFPLHIARAAKEKGNRVVAVCHVGETDPALLDLVDESIWIKVGQLGKLLKFIRSTKASKAIFSGGISRVKLFRGATPDLTGIRLIAKVGSVRDDVFLRAIAGEVEKAGAQVISAGVFLERYIPQRGLLTKRAPTPEEFSNARLGWKAAKALGALDTGQTVIVAGSLVVALECVEGTDEVIKRGGVLAGVSQCTVVKVAKPQQDLRLDLPSLGVVTIDVMKNANAMALFLEAGKAMILDPEAFVRAANDRNITVFVASDENDLK